MTHPWAWWCCRAGLYKYCIWPAMADTPQKAWLLWGTGHLLSPRPYLVESNLCGGSAYDRALCVVSSLPRHTYLGCPQLPPLFGIIACRLFISHSKEISEEKHLDLMKGELFSGSIGLWTWFLPHRSSSISSQKRPVVYRSREVSQRSGNIHATLRAERRVWNDLPVKTLQLFLSKHGHHFLWAFPKSYPCMNLYWSHCWRKPTASSSPPHPALSYKWRGWTQARFCLELCKKFLLRRWLNLIGLTCVGGYVELLASGCQSFWVGNGTERHMEANNTEHLAYLGENI